MNSVVRLAIVDPNDVTRSSLKNLLLGIDMVWLEAECSRYEFFIDVVDQTNPHIALISLDSDVDRAIALVAEVKQKSRQCDVLVVSASQEGSVILQAMRSGAREFLNLPLKIEDFLAALDRIMTVAGGFGGDDRVRSSQVIAVAGASGGVGCTSLTTNLACILAQDTNNAVVILDLDLSLGDADIWLDIIPDYTIQDVADNISRLDYSLLKRSLTRHDCGAYLLPRPVRMDETTAISADELRRVIALLRATFTHLVIDVSKSYSSLDLAAMQAADHILMVTQLDLPCLRNVVRLLEFLDTQDDLSDKIRVVVNRLGLEDAQISLNKALDTIGREIHAEIPNDYATMVESRNNGVPLVDQAPKTKLTRSLTDLAASLQTPQTDETQGEEKKAKKGLFGFLSNSSR